jgi:leader peptidase (prepilin peptidase)/N-methyltransferase
LPSASANTGALAVGATAGLVISLLLLASGLIKRSYESEISEDEKGIKQKNSKEEIAIPNNEEESAEPDWTSNGVNHRLEACREIVFLLPIIVCSMALLWIVREVTPVRAWWEDFSQHPVVAGLLGSLWGYFVGCGLVWSIRIFGTLGFGKEAMGLGDVHLMGAAGAVIGPLYVVVAFFVAPFFGLAWAGFQMFFKKIRQIPYGPFLSLGIFVVIILHDWIRDYLSFVFR